MSTESADGIISDAGTDRIGRPGNGGQYMDKLRFRQIHQDFHTSPVIKGIGAAFDREEFKDICICHAVHELCQHKMYSIPDLLRMNDFWCEVKVTHQLLSDRDGKRFSCIERKGGK